MATHLSARGYAASRRARGLPGGTLTAVQRAISAGRIQLRPDGRIDPAQADAAWDASTDATRRPHTNGVQAPLSLASAKVAESIERTRQLRLANDAREGRLVDIQDVELKWAEIIVQARDGLRAIPARARQVLGLEWDATAKLAELIDRVLEDMAERGARGERSAPDDAGGRGVATGGEVVEPTGAHGRRPDRISDEGPRPSHSSADGAGGSPDGLESGPRSGREGAQHGETRTTDAGDRTLGSAPV